MVEDRAMAALNAFFAAFNNVKVDQDIVTVDSNAHCVHRCVPICTRNGLADDLRMCFVRCRDRCLEELADEVLHPKHTLFNPFISSQSHTEDHDDHHYDDDRGYTTLHIFVIFTIIITLLSAYYVIDRRNVNTIRLWIRSLLALSKRRLVKHERFE